MSYHHDRLGLTELFKGLELVPDTSPPVYILGETLIGYDKLEQIKVLAINQQDFPAKKWVDMLFEMMFGISNHMSAVPKS